MLNIEGINTGYGDLKVLFNVGLHVDEGEVVALVGSNGAGKTTLLRAISGEVPLSCGSIHFGSTDLSRIPQHKRAEIGICHIPQGRGILTTLTIKDNLILGSFSRRTKNKRNELIARSLDLFPILKERLSHLAGSLSGGQQQMLAIARAMVMDPILLMMDEPSLGLAPILVDEVFEIIDQLKSTGVSILLVEQNLVKALSLADRGYVLETGRIIMEGKAKELLSNPGIRKAYLGID